VNEKERGHEMETDAVKLAPSTASQRRMVRETTSKSLMAKSAKE